MTTKIDWCDEVWNPVWGCENDCEYCFARKIAKRFGYKVAQKERKYMWENKGIENLGFLEYDLTHFNPTFLESNLNKKFPKKPSSIFVNSMSDVCYWEYKWMNKVIDKIKEYPQHTFLFLTKEPSVYNNWFWPSNCWLGVTINKKSDLRKIKVFLFFDKHKTFLSIEPIQSKIPFYSLSESYINWLIIGAETGNRKNKIIPEPDWIEQFTKLDIPVFMKDNLKPYYNKKLLKEFPK